MALSFSARTKVGILRREFMSVLAVSFSRTPLVLGVIQAGKKSHMVWVDTARVEAEVVDRHLFRDWTVFLFPRETVRQLLAAAWPHAGPVSIRIAVQEPFPAAGVSIQLPFLSFHAARLFSRSYSRRCLRRWRSSSMSACKRAGPSGSGL